MNIALIMTAVQHGATVVNHVEVTELIKDHDGRVRGTKMRDVLTGDEWSVKAKGVINATGPFTDGLRKLDEPQSSDIVSPSSGVHITLPNYYAPKNMGLIDPSTSDGRVIFFLPWQGHTIAGTTDAAASVTQNPIPQEEEIQWILDEVRNYLNPSIRVRRGDVLSAWSGLRPLVTDPAAKNTESLVRNHMINVSQSGLLTIGALNQGVLRHGQPLTFVATAGGKWTSYRHMSEDTVDRAILEYGLQNRVKRECVTKDVQLVGRFVLNSRLASKMLTNPFFSHKSHGWSKLMFVKLIQQFGLESDVAQHLSETYGDRAWGVCSMAKPTGLRWPVHGNRLDPTFPYIDAEVTWACRREYAQKAVDVIARRTRLSFLNAEAALDALPKVIDIMATELGWSKSRMNQEFQDATAFLESMGIARTRTIGLTLEDVRDGKHKVPRGVDDYKKAVFTASEVEELKVSSSFA
ncbi:glycerol-3-phosphate dehydrogenase, partial [Phenoliferia sp. Uapishka_3]